MSTTPLAIAFLAFLAPATLHLAAAQTPAPSVSPSASPSGSPSVGPTAPPTQTPTSPTPPPPTAAPARDLTDDLARCPARADLVEQNVVTGGDRRRRRDELDAVSGGLSARWRRQNTADDDDDDTCSSHTDCPENTYCDSDERCWPCSSCHQSQDAIDGTCPSKCGPAPPPKVAIPPIQLATWNSTACRAQCFCTDGELPAGRDSCQACAAQGDTNPALTTRESCCSSCCDRVVYLRLVFNGDYSTDSAVNANTTSAIRSFLTISYGRAFNYSERLSDSQILGVSLSAGSVIALVQFDSAINSSSLLVFANYLVDRQNIVRFGPNYYPWRLSNNMVLTMVSLPTDNDADPANTSPVGSGSGSGGDDASSGMSGGAIAGLVVGIIALLGLVAVAVWIFQMRPKSAGTSAGTSAAATAGRLLSRFSNPAATLKYAGAGTLAFVLLLAIIGTALESMIVFDGEGDTYVGIGAWTWKITADISGTAVSLHGDTCENTFMTGGRAVPEASQQGCYDALASKCQAGKAFSILGIFSNVAAVAAGILPTAGVLPLPFAQSIALATAGFATFSYMIVFSVWAATFNGKALGADTIDDSNCGFGGGEYAGTTEVALGPAHGLFVSAFFFSLIGIGLYVAGFILAPKYGWVGSNPYGDGESSGDEGRCPKCRSKLAVCVCNDKEARRTSKARPASFIPNAAADGC